MKFTNSFLIFDLELTCWEENTDNISEIIQFGWVIWDIKTGNITQPNSIYIKPQLSQISQYCTNLTGITKKQVKSGIIWQDAIRYLSKTGIKKHPIITWGDDIKDLENNSKLYNVDNFLNQPSIDLSVLYGNLKFKNSINLSHALELEEIKTEDGKQFHDAGNDAYYTALLAKKVLSKLC